MKTDGEKPGISSTAYLRVDGKIIEKGDFSVCAIAGWKPRFSKLQEAVFCAVDNKNSLIQHRLRESSNFSHLDQCNHVCVVKNNQVLYISEKDEEALNFLKKIRD